MTKATGGARDSREADSALALHALVWTLGDAARADRLLALTGLDAEALRAGAGSAAVQGAVLAFLAGHEADLVACADAMGVDAAALVAAGARLEAAA